MAFIKPEEIAKNIGLEQGMTVADFGAGSGHYVIPMAKLVGSSGRVYAIDVQKDLLKAIKANTAANNLLNVEIIWSDLETPEASRLENNSIDAVMISNILFQVEKKEQIVKESFRILKNEGIAVVIDWIDSFGGLGPKKENVIKKEDCIKLFADMGFEIKKEIPAGENHYGIIFIKHE
jgi:ubiquinone/menaquinone biosynthesis C-methylase UbiE